MIFNQDNKLDPAEFVEEETNQTKTPLDNSGTPPLLNQSLSQYSPPIDSPDAPDSPPPGVCKDVSDTAFLASVGDLPGDRLTYIDDNILGV